MTTQEYISSVKDVIYLTYCAVNDRIPSSSRIEKMNIDNVRGSADRHMLTAACAMALESAGVRNEELRQARGKALRKTASMDIDKQRLFAQLESRGVWYMPLKGSVLKDIYPKFGMRQMSDVDILFDASHANDVKEALESLGYTTESFGKGNHDVYHKEPVSNFEMHRDLFGQSYDAKVYEYYKNVKERLVKDEGNGFGFHFTPEDLYIYITAHEYKHYSLGGTGLRSFLDIYVYLSHFDNKLDMSYIEAECEKLGISDFEKKSRSLALDLFGGSGLTDEDKEMLKYVVSSGTYGTNENYVKNRVNDYGGGFAGKLRFAVGRIFPPMSVVKDAYPFFYKVKILYPFLIVYRFGKALTVSRKKIAGELKIMRKM